MTYISAVCIGCASCKINAHRYRHLGLARRQKFCTKARMQCVGLKIFVCLRLLERRLAAKRNQQLDEMAKTTGQNDIF